MESAVNVQFGAGGNKLEGFLNHDAEVDISKPLPYNTSTVDFILMEHVWEHIGPHDAVRCLQECWRILNPGGVLRLCVPVLDRLTPDHALDIIFGHGHQGIYTTEVVHHLFRITGFVSIMETERKACDGHWRVIGCDKDDQESLRIEGVK